MENVITVSNKNNASLHIHMSRDSPYINVCIMVRTHSLCFQSLSIKTPQVPQVCYLPRETCDKTSLCGAEVQIVVCSCSYHEVSVIWCSLLGWCSNKRPLEVPLGTSSGLRLCSRGACISLSQAIGSADARAWHLFPGERRGEHGVQHSQHLQQVLLIADLSLQQVLQTLQLHVHHRWLANDRLIDV